MDAACKKAFLVGATGSVFGGGGEGSFFLDSDELTLLKKLELFVDDADDGRLVRGGPEGASLTLSLEARENKRGRSLSVLLLLLLPLRERSLVLWSMLGLRVATSTGAGGISMLTRLLRLKLVASGRVSEGDLIEGFFDARLGVRKSDVLLSSLLNFVVT